MSLPSLLPFLLPIANAQAVVWAVPSAAAAELVACPGDGPPTINPREESLAIGAARRGRLVAGASVLASASLLAALVWWLRSGGGRAEQSRSPIQTHDASEEEPVMANEVSPYP